MRCIARFNLKPFLCGNSGPQWGGWFRNEINSVDDLRGLRYRTTGLNSEVMSKLGVAVEAMPGPAMFQALQSGALDAGEFIGPWSDSALGFPAGSRPTTMTTAWASPHRPRNARSTSMPGTRWMTT